MFPYNVAVKNLLVVRESDQLIVLSEQEVAAISLHRCHLANKSCGDCVALQDPYCAWDIKRNTCQPFRHVAHVQLTQCKQTAVIFQKCQQTAVTFQKCQQSAVTFRKCQQTAVKSRLDMGHVPTSSQEELIEMFIPMDEETQQRSQCYIYDMDSGILSNGNKTKLKCQHGWQYNFTEHYVSASTQVKVKIRDISN